MFSTTGLIQGDLSIHSLRSFSQDDRGIFLMFPAYQFSCFAWLGVTPAGVVSSIERQMEQAERLFHNIFLKPATRNTNQDHTSQLQT
ncbi:MAG: hypothetical protein JJU13_07125, partial [Balneolaceae bacterium]|nr:hypothetical protein [Balneolaceae bacterium]